MTVGIGRQSSPVPDPASHPAVEALRRDLPPGSLGETGVFRGQVWAGVVPARILEALRLLRDHPGLAYNFLSDLAGVHHPDRVEAPLEVVYQLTSLSRADRIRLKVRLGEGEACPSAVGVFAGAGWMERETFDLLGIAFSGHPDLRRILNPDGFAGHPLRKDFPTRGHGPW